jgi:serine/threonine-protein kinase PknK
MTPHALRSTARARISARDRWGSKPCQIPPVVAARLRSTRTVPQNDGIATLTAELDEDSAVRLLAASDSPDDQWQACRRAADLAKGIDGQRRPLAALQAELLLVETLTATGRVAEARAGVLQVSARCAEVGLPRLLVDAGLS